MTAFDFNQYLEPLTKSKISILEKEKKNEFSSFLDLHPFGVLWYHEPVNKQELEKKLNLWGKELMTTAPKYCFLTIDLSMKMANGQLLLKFFTLPRTVYWLAN